MALSAKALTTITRMDTLTGLSISTVWEPYIEEASEMLISLLNRQIYYVAGKVEYVKGYGSDIITVLKHAPLKTITSIYLDDGNTSDLVTATDYMIDNDGGAGDSGDIRMISGNWDYTGLTAGDIAKSAYARSEKAFYKITYTGGWITPQQAADAVGTRDLPYDIERAAIDLSKSFYYDRSTNLFVTQKKISRSSYKRTSEIDFPSVKRVINKYARLSVA